MTIISDSGLHMCACDSCGTELNTHDDFREAVNEAKREGWRVACDDGEWTHMCGPCRDDSVQSALDRARRMFGKR